MPNMATGNEENGSDMQSESEESSYSMARQKLESLLNKNMRIRMTDGRTLVGLFLCTDRDCNVILGSAQEFLKSTGGPLLPVGTSVLTTGTPLDQTHSLKGSQGSWVLP
ncbi:N-alpha-acetyltransferase 38, NatC auxiliary subunit isoform X2 [Alosa alosa]|uniref:N-alpha-acetyltransferase 38, NatC auxiliary subunit isoform X2 n=1 Tax=Alosa sapidissima TaxID=34773 RepID=UPI001C093C83|nr:N-alpha-acetyltransferase 38, NatC auxiliary subunit isoform X2 [Alosa sapidissima]XP_048125175.1 N-alpha-acetyltransferase 38, NatC auxiliary subunit isoform X2 [Alosa alosa]